MLDLFFNRFYFLDEIVYNNFMDETSTPTPAPVKQPGRSFGKLSAILIIILLALVLVGGGYILGTRGSIKPVEQTTTSAPISPTATVSGNQATVSPSVSPSPTPFTGKTVSAGANIGVFFPYKIQIPDGWTTNHTGDNTNIDKLIISKGNYSITIQQAGGGAGSCTYPGDPAQPMGQSFTKFVDFQSLDTDFRRSGDNQGLLWTLCEKKPAGFQFPTTYGYISYASSGTVDPAVFTQMDSIVASIVKQ